MTDCSSCRFADAVVVDEARPELICRRFPPNGGNWLVVFADDWCGEWQPSLVLPERPRRFRRLRRAGQRLVDGTAWGSGVILGAVGAVALTLYVLRTT